MVFPSLSLTLSLFASAIRYHHHTLELTTIIPLNHHLPRPAITSAVAASIKLFSRAFSSTYHFHHFQWNATNVRQSMQTHTHTHSYSTGLLNIFTLLLLLYSMKWENSFITFRIVVVLRIDIRCFKHIKL